MVDDHADTLAVMTMLFSARGHRVTAAESLAQARAALAALPGGFDVAVVDRVLPDGDGIDLVPDLAAVGVPAVALTALAYDQDVADSLGGGFAAHVSKPTHAETLLAVIGRVLEVTPPPSATARGGRTEGTRPAIAHVTDVTACV